jgi:ADP-heptose:LPS heptosyltransferase
MMSSRREIRLNVLKSIGRLTSQRPEAPLRGNARVLLIRPDHIGDVLLTTPALALLRQSMPSAYLAALVGPWSADVIRRGPPINAVSTCEFPGFTRRSSRWVGEPYFELRRARELRRQHFDLAIIARPDHWWGALLAAAAGIPHRVGFNVPECAPFLTETLEAPPEAHVAELSLMLADRVAKMAGATVPITDRRPIFNVMETERLQARDAISRIRFDADGPLIVLHPGAGTELKLWPSEHWASTLDLLRERENARTIIVSASSERSIVDRIQDASRFEHAYLNTDRGLGFLAAVLETADVVLGSDNGPLHLAAAMGAATVRLYGPTDPALFGPWPSDERQVVLRAMTPCSPCGYVTDPPCGATTRPLCLMEQSPQDIVDAASWVLRRSAWPESAVL